MFSFKQSFTLSLAKFTLLFSLMLGNFTLSTQAEETSLAHPAPSLPGRVCTVDRFQQPSIPPIKKLDILFVMDNSHSMNRHWQIMANKIYSMVDELPSDVHIRIAVMLGVIDKWNGQLFAPYGVPVVLDNQRHSASQISRYLQRTFSSAMNEVDFTGAGETLFHSLYHGVTTRAQANQKLGFFRGDAALSVVFMSDDAETGFPYPSRQPWNLPPKCNYGPHEQVRRTHYVPRGIHTESTFQALKKLKGDMPLVTNAFVNITKEDILVDNSMDASCIYDSPGYGYFDIVKKTDGVLYSIHRERGKGLSLVGKLLKNRMELRYEFPLSKSAEKVDPASIQAAVDSGIVSHTYTGATNSVRIDNPGRPGSLVEIRHCEPTGQKEWSLSDFEGTTEQRSARLQWKTAEYATRGRLFFGQSKDSLSNVMESAKSTNHEVMVPNLLPNTLYHFQVESSDEYGVSKRTEILSLRTKPDWELSALAGQAARTSVSLNWSTSDYPTLNKVIWGVAPNVLTNTSEESAASTSHSLKVEGLNANTTYYFQAIARDEFGLEKRSNVLALQTAQDWAIVGFQGTALRNSVSLQWETPDYPTVSKLRFGLSPDALSQEVPANSNGVLHTAIVENLQPGTTYYFQAVAQDDLGTGKASEVLAVETIKSWNLAGLLAASEVNSISIRWNTEGFATSGYVLWGLSAESLLYRADAGSNVSEHTAFVESLTPDTLYYFQVVARDRLGLERRSETFAVRTKAAVEEPLPEWSIENLGATTSVRSAVIAWETTEHDTVGKVRYGTNPSALTFMSNETASGRIHSVTLEGLEPDTVYFVEALGRDDKGQEKISNMISMKTEGENLPPTWKIVGFDASTSANAAAVIWQTPGAKTKAILRVGLSATDLSLQTISVDTPAELHLVEVKNLQPNTSYFFQVTGIDERGNEIESHVLTKRTKGQ